MIPAARRFLCFGFSLFAATCAQAVPDVATRSVPSRPAAIKAVKLNGIEYLSATDAAIRLRLKGTWTMAGHKLTLADKETKAEWEADSREIMVDGLRIFLGDPIVARRGQFYISRTDFERGLVPLVRPALIVPLPPHPRTIALDPGHGGKDAGMENKTLGLQEKVLVLDVAFRTKKILEANGYRVVLTRSDDRQLGPDKKTDWRKRWEIANAARADLFVSIHFNSLYPDTKTSGTEVFTFTRAGQRSDQSWGVNEINDTEQESVPINRFDAWSSLLAHAMHREVITHLTTFDRGQKTKHLGVLRGLGCPGVLVESVFLSNEREAKRAATPAYRQQIAGAIANGVRAYSEAIAALEPSPAAAVGSPK